MTTFDIEEFVSQGITRYRLMVLPKDKLLKVADHFKVQLGEDAKKPEITNALLLFFRIPDWLAEQVNDSSHFEIRKPDQSVEYWENEVLRITKELKDISKQRQEYKQFMETCEKMVADEDVGAEEALICANGVFVCEGRVKNYCALEKGLYHQPICEDKEALVQLSEEQIFDLRESAWLFEETEILNCSEEANDFEPMPIMQGRHQLTFESDTCDIVTGSVLCERHAEWSEDPNTLMDITILLMKVLIC